MMDVFLYRDYRTMIRDFIASQKLHGGSLNYSRLAQAIKIQKSYLSQILAGRCDLSTDQLYRLSKVMGLTQDQFDYLFLLLESERTQIPERKEILRSRVSQIQIERAQLSA